MNRIAQAGFIAALPAHPFIAFSMWSMTSVCSRCGLDRMTSEEWSVDDSRDGRSSGEAG